MDPQCRPAAQLRSDRTDLDTGIAQGFAEMLAVGVLRGVAQEYASRVVTVFLVRRPLNVGSAGRPFHGSFVIVP